MPAFFSINITPSVTRDNASIEAFNTTLSVDVNVTRNFDILANSVSSVDSILTNIRGFDLNLFDNASLTCDAVADKVLTPQILPASTDLIADNGAIFGFGSIAFGGEILPTDFQAVSDVSFLGGKLIDNIVNARYSSLGYVLEGYVGEEPAAKAFAELRAESDITILLDVFVTSTLEANIKVDYNPTISINAEASLTCSVTGLSLIQMTAFSDAAVNIDFNRIRENDADIVAVSSLGADADFTAELIQLVVSAASVEANIAKILGGIEIGDLPSAFTVECIGDDLILKLAEADLETQTTLTASMSRRLFGEAHLSASGGVLTQVSVEHIDEYVYMIPAEGWEYKIEGESRDYEIVGETRIREIAAESRIRRVKGETRIHNIT